MDQKPNHEFVVLYEADSRPTSSTDGSSRARRGDKGAIHPKDLGTSIGVHVRPVPILGRTNYYKVVVPQVDRAPITTDVVQYIEQFTDGVLTKNIRPLVVPTRELCSGRIFRSGSKVTECS